MVNMVQKSRYVKEMVPCQNSVQELMRIILCLTQGQILNIVAYVEH